MQHVTQPLLVVGSSSSEEEHWKALLLGWQTYHMGWKKPWWQSVACPVDVDDETAFRQGETVLPSNISSFTTSNSALQAWHKQPVFSGPGTRNTTVYVCHVHSSSSVRLPVPEMLILSRPGRQLHLEQTQCTSMCSPWKANKPGAKHDKEIHEHQPTGLSLPGW